MTSHPTAEIDGRRLTERTQLQIAPMSDKISADEYSNLVVSILDVTILLVSILCSQLYCEEAQFQHTTAFYAKAYLDVFVNKIAAFETSRLPIVALVCLWIAVKFNEPRSKSQCFSISTIHAALNSAASEEDIRSIETLVVELLDYKLDYTTPFDYVQPFFQGFPCLSALKSLMPQLLSFAISVPELTLCNSADLFYGVLLGSLQIKNCVLSAAQLEVLSIHIINKQSASAIATRFTSAYYELSGQEEAANPENNSMDL